MDVTSSPFHVSVHFEAEDIQQYEEWRDEECWAWLERWQSKLKDAMYDALQGVLYDVLQERGRLPKDERPADPFDYDDLDE